MRVAIPFGLGPSHSLTSNLWIGVNFIFYFGTSYFQNSGIKNPFIISVITDVVNVSSTIPGLYLVEKWGRRPLLMFGAIGMKRYVG